MKKVIYILAALLVGLVLGRFLVEPKVVTETVVEYRIINTSALAPSIVSEPIGTRVEKVRLVLADHLRDATKKVNDQFGDSTTMVDHIEELHEMVDSAEVELPIRDYTFTDDSTYTITARGVFVESLPRIEFLPRSVTTTRTETLERTPRIIHGLQAGGGVALTPKGLQPAIYFGYGLIIRF